MGEQTGGPSPKFRTSPGQQSHTTQIIQRKKYHHKEENTVGHPAKNAKVKDKAFPKEES